MKTFCMWVVTVAFALGSWGCGGTQKTAKADATTAKKVTKKPLKKMKGNRMEMAEEDE